MGKKTKVKLTIKHEYDKDLYCTGLNRNLPAPFEMLHLGILSRTQTKRFIQYLKEYKIPAKSCVSKLEIQEVKKQSTIIVNGADTEKTTENMECQLNITITQNIKNKGGLNCNYWKNRTQLCAECLKNAECHDEFMQRAFIEKFKQLQTISDCNRQYGN